MGKKKSKKSSGKKITSRVSNKNTARPGRSRKALVVAILAMATVTGGYFFYSKYKEPTDSKVQAENVASSGAANNLRGGETRTTLEPSLFTGKVAKAYLIARESRELLDSIYCYCHCKESFGHKSLLTCFVDQHAARCSICLEQATYASSRLQDGYSVRQVRQAVDQKFWRPFS